MQKISENITYLEAIHSATAKRKGLDNTPNAEQLDNMYRTAEFIFQPLRLWVGGPIKVNSFFRSVAVNRAVGGTSRSQHCKGQALDLDDVYGHKTNAEMFMYIKDHLDFDQLIWEFGTNTNPNWIHVSYVSAKENRNRVLKAVREEGKTIYKIMN